jgi:hypothetical protein
LLQRPHLRRCALGTVVLGLVAVLAVPARAQLGRSGETVLWRESFDSGALDFFDPFGHDRRLLARVYKVIRDGDDPVLHALDDATSGAVPAIHFGHSFEESAPALDRVHALRWRWRVLRQPDVRADAWTDLGASIYVVVRAPTVLRGGRGFKLGWLAKPGPSDTYQHGLLQIPLEQGGASGGWRSESVDLCALYRRTFGPCEGEHVLYVGVMSDADGTRSVAEAEYDDFELVASP